MFILHDLLKDFKGDFAHSRKGDERATWFVSCIIAIMVPFTSSKTSNLLRSLKVLFGFTAISRRRFYTFMASPKLPWQKLWKRVWKMIPNPFTDGHLITVLDDFINPKTGKKIFGCHNFYDHAAKTNQSRYPWSQNVVVVGLLKTIKGRGHFAFSDIRRCIAEAAMNNHFDLLCPVPRKSVIHSLVTTLLRMAA